ncbi:MAG: hypothetical protein MUD06_09655 [Rhodospirillales bacterium]|nr:hypothetical protein [Rhodospirillales bacterium]
MRQELKLMAAAVALVAVAGCSNRYLDDAKSAQPRGDAFEAALASHYLDLARSERKQGDVDAATTFARRSTASAEGQLVLPDDFTNRKIASRYRGDLGSARQRLLAALDGNGRTTAPDAAARAQVLFDCWVEQSEESLQPDTSATAARASSSRSQRSKAPSPAGRRPRSRRRPAPIWCSSTSTAPT